MNARTVTSVVYKKYFSNSSIHVGHLGSLLIIVRFHFNRSGMGPRFYISNKLLVGVVLLAYGLSLCSEG